MTGGIVTYQGELAGFGVTAFFVLSGFVIAFVADTKEKSLKAFAVSRMARVYSVALPALLLTIAIDLLTMHYGWPRHLPAYQYKNFLLYLGLAVTFTGHAGPLNEPTFGNAMYWSLDYEVWYYLIFAAAIFYDGRKRLLLVTLLVLLSGPRIALLMPMWLLGVAIYHATKSAVLERRTALAAFLFSFAALIAIRAFGIDNAIDRSVNATFGGWPAHYLSNSQNFASNYLAALLFGINIFSAAYLPMSLFKVERVRKSIQYAASFTFVLYLTHYPLLFFYANVLHHNPHSLASVMAIVSATLVTVWLLGFVTEHRKDAWRRFFHHLLSWLSNLISERMPLLDRLITTAR
jgi:peptidoglycan/LPS O-acetylase OafA/YrhL